MYRYKLMLKNNIAPLMIVVLAVVVLILSIGLAYERGHNNGYNEGWNDGTAYGWQGCIEENNLYNRYGTIKMEESK